MKKIIVVISLCLSIILFISSSCASNNAQDLEFEFEAMRCYENTSGKTVGERLYNCGMSLYFKCDLYESQYRCKEGRYYVRMSNGGPNNIRVKNESGVIWIWIESDNEESKSEGGDLKQEESSEKMFEYPYQGGD